MSKVNVPIALMSVAASVMLWANVYNQKNILPEQKVVSATLSTTRFDTQKFVVTDIPDTISLTLAGDTDQIRTATQQPLTAFVDLYDAVPGTKSYPVSVFPAVARGFLVNSAITARIKVEALATKELSKITVLKNGSVPEGQLESSTDTFPARVLVTGPNDAVTKVVGIQIIAAYDSAVTSPEGMLLEAKPVDANGRVVQNVILSDLSEKPKYDESTLENPFRMRVRIKLVPDVVSSSPLQR